MRAGMILAGLAWLAAGAAQAQTVTVTVTRLDGRDVPYYDWPLPVHAAGRVRYEQMNAYPDTSCPPPQVKKGGRQTIPPDVLCDRGPDWTPPKTYPFLAYGWPGVYFEARFSGDEVVVRLDDPVSDLELLIDGQPVQRFSRPGQAVYDVTGLTSGAHLVRLERLSEDLTTGGVFGGFFIPEGEVSIGTHYPPPEPHHQGEALPPPHRGRAIEFIGDSYLTGYGVHSPKHDCTPEDLHANTDTQVAWGALVAHHYDADYQINATSGIGMVRNYDGGAGPVMPDRYASDLMGDAVTMHVNKAVTVSPLTIENAAVPFGDRDGGYLEVLHPQIIVIGLGDNDFATPVKPGEKWADQAALRGDFITTYLTFLKNLRARNPHAMIILMDYGEPELIPDIQAIVAMSKARGDGNVIAWSAGAGFEQSGCDWHLSPHDHERIAAGIEAVIDAQPDVWK